MNNESKPKYLTIKEEIKHTIVNGLYPKGMRFPSDAKLHAEFGVSRITAVRAMEELAREGLVTRIKGSGTYVASSIKSPLIPGRTLKLAMLWYDSIIPEDFTGYGLGVEMLYGALSEWGYENPEPEFVPFSQNDPTRVLFKKPELGLAVECLGHSVESRTRHPSLDEVRKGNYDGVIVVGIENDEWVNQLLELGIPTVLMDYPGHRFATQADQVFFDPFHGTYEAISYFLQKGLRRIHFLGRLRYVGAPHESMSVDEYNKYIIGKTKTALDTIPRLNAYHQAMWELDIDTQKEWIHYCLDYEDQIPNLAKKLASLPENERPEAVVCHEISQADILKKTFEDRGLPLEAVGSTAFPNGMHKALSITADPRAQGEIAGFLLLSRIRHPERPFINAGVRLEFELSDKEKE